MNIDNSFSGAGSIESKNASSFTKILLKLTAKFFETSSSKFSNEVENELKMIGDHLGIESMSIGVFSDDETEFSITYSWLASGSPVGRQISCKKIPWIMNKIIKKEAVVLTRLQEDLPEEASREKEYLQAQNIKSAVILPLIAGESVLGVLVLVAFRNERYWSYKEIQQFQEIGEVFAYAMERQKSFGDIDDLLKFEQLVSEISATYINLPVRKIENAIEYGLSRIGKLLQADRCALWQFSEEEGVFRPTLIWQKEDIKSDLNRVVNTNIASGRLQYLFDKWLNGESIKTKTPDDLPEEASLFKELELEIHAKSHLSVPFSVGGTILGAITIVTTRSYRVWPDKLTNRLRLLGEIFGNALMRKRKEQELINAYQEIKRLKTEIEDDCIYLQEEIKMTHNFSEIIGQSRQLKKVLFDIEQVAPTDTTVLVLGETGTGKELISRAIHNTSGRKDRPLIKLNCATLPANLIENELFGHEKGAFTDASASHKGRFELANGTTIFLDEIGELPLALQAKLLRVLEDGQFERLGGRTTIKTDARVIAATNQDLEEKAKDGRFRRDLWYRLSPFVIKLPPLRERKEDIPMLVNWFVKIYCTKLGKPIQSFSARSIKKLQGYDWPGNIRELEHVIERAVIKSRGSTLSLSDRFDTSLKSIKENRSNKTLSEIERDYIIQILAQTKGRVHGPNGAAKILGLNPSTLRFRMKRLGIEKQTTYSRKSA
ncbi:MAG: sigma 54-interacting transcriptional regulator [Desulfatitalea sp.]|nr:sigma 54-interacting transcriptional regulator [Desulfatitalea sp.]NNJ99646.1 sigma 54-interacting transcriptional regulator [Desulfatitalea sp.]